MPEKLPSLANWTASKLKRLAAQREKIESNLAQYSSYLQYVEESLLAPKEGEVLTMKTETVQASSERTNISIPVSYLEAYHSS